MVGYQLSKNDWVTPFFVIFRSVREILLVTVFLEHPVVIFFADIWFLLWNGVHGGQVFLYFVCSVACLLCVPTLCPCTLCLATPWQLVRIPKPWPSGAPAWNTGPVLKRQTCANSSHDSSLRCKGKSCHTQTFFVNQFIYWTDLGQPKVVLTQLV